MIYLDGSLGLYAKPIIGQASLPGTRHASACAASSYTGIHSAGLPGAIQCRQKDIWCRDEFIDGASRYHRGFFVSLRRRRRQPLIAISAAFAPVPANFTTSDFAEARSTAPQYLLH